MELTRHTVRPGADWARKPPRDKGLAAGEDVRTVLDVDLPEVCCTLVPGSWVGARRPFHGAVDQESWVGSWVFSVFLSASRVVFKTPKNLVLKKQKIVPWQDELVRRYRAYSKTTQMSLYRVDPDGPSSALSSTP